MPEGRWNVWKAAAIGIALMVATAMVTGLVVANRVGTEKIKPATSAAHVQRPTPRYAASRPSSSDIAACNQYASSVVGDTTTEVVKDVLIGGAIGAGVGAAGGAIAGGGKGAGKGAGIGGLVGATAGTLYGLNKTNQHDARYAGAYQTCMQRRGFTQ